MLSIQDPKQAFETVAAVRTKDLMKHLCVPIRPEFLQQYSDRSFCLDSNYILCVTMNNQFEHLYVHTPLCAAPQKGFFCIFPAIQLNSHGLLLHAIQRAIGRAGIIKEDAAASGWVRNPLTEPKVYGVGSLSGREVNDKLLVLLRQCTQPADSLHLSEL